MAPPQRIGGWTTRFTAVASTLAMMVVGWKFILSTSPRSSSLSSSSSLSPSPPSPSSSNFGSPARLQQFEPVVIGTLQEEEAKAKAAARQEDKNRQPPPLPPVEYHLDSGDIVPMKDAVKRYFDRFDAITQRPRSQPYTLTECRDTALHCGFACGNLREQFQACWCVRVWKQTVAYLSKDTETFNSNGNLLLNDWKTDPFANLQMTLNLLWATVKTQNELVVETPVYLVINVYDYPRLFLPEPATQMENVPTVTLGHPAESTDMGYEFFGQMAFTAGFPEGLEPCDLLQEDKNLPPERRCCNTTHHFPLFSWSINPVFNFDILAPNRHSGSCKSKFFDKEIGHVPWHEKSRTVLHRGSARCHALQTEDQRTRFCAHVQSQRWFLEESLNLTINIWGEPLTPSQQAQAKFLILLDGAVAAFRSTWYLSTGSVILAAGNHVDFRTALLRPYVHYIPFRADFSDFAEALELVARNDKYAQWVAANARRAGHILSEKGEDGGILDGGHEGDKTMWAALLQEYKSRYEFVVNDEELNAQFTSETNCDGYRECEHDCQPKGDRCLGEEYVCQGKIQDGYMLNEGVVTYLDRNEDENGTDENSDENNNHDADDDNDIDENNRDSIDDKESDESVTEDSDESVNKDTDDDKDTDENNND